LKVNHSRFDSRSDDECVTLCNAMSRNRRSKQSFPELSEFEVSVLIVLKHSHKATADEIRRGLTRPSDAFAVRAALLRLAERMLVVQSIAHGKIFYQAAAQSNRDDDLAPTRAQAMATAAVLL
jgi:hypothetical protein